MTEEIYTGFDCCKDYKVPGRTPRIYPRNITMEVGGVKNLYLLTVHPGCYKSCFTWKILSGGGWLDPEEGIETFYHAPSDNEGCLSSPVIQASCPREVLDTIYIGVTGLVRPIPAALEADFWKQPEFDIGGIYPHLEGMKYCDKDPRIHFWTLNIDEFGCDGSRTHRHQVGLVNQLVEAVCGIWIQQDRFRVLRRIDGVLQSYGYPIWRPLETVKLYVISLFVQDRVAETSRVMWLKFRIANASWPFGKDFTLRPGGTLDLRMDKVIEMDCCPFSIFPEENEK